MLPVNPCIFCSTLKKSLPSYLLPAPAVVIVVCAAQVVADGPPARGPLRPAALASGGAAAVEVRTLALGGREGGKVPDCATLPPIALLALQKPLIQSILTFDRFSRFAVIKFLSVRCLKKDFLVYMCSRKASNLAGQFIPYDPKLNKKRYLRFQHSNL